jgi:hypothetical protein
MNVSRRIFLAVLTTLCMTVFASHAAAQGGTWAIEAPLPVPSGLGSFAFGSINGEVYAVGGQLGSSVVATLEVYNPATNTWTTKTSMPTARVYPSAAVVNGLLYVIGGCTTFDCAGLTGTVEAYDPVTDAWTTKAPMPTPRREFGVGVINGVVYAVGGFSGGGASSSNEVYDPSTNSWSTKASKPTSLGQVKSEGVNGLLYAMGGYDGCCSLYATVEAYNPSTDAWITKASLPSPRAAGGTGVINATIYYAGGTSTESQLVAYDPIGDAWTTDATSPTQCQATCAGTAANGVLYVSGPTSVDDFMAFTPTASPQQLLTSLVGTIASFNIVSGIANSLDAKLLAAQSSLAAAKKNDLNTACNQIGAFINSVSAQSGNQITASQASQLVGQANLIMSALMCP